MTDLERTHSAVNFDPANEELAYESAIDLRDLISLQDVMDELKLGPNGGLLYCIDFLLANFSWLKD